MWPHVMCVVVPLHIFEFEGGKRMDGDVEVHFEEGHFEVVAMRGGRGLSLDYGC